MNGRCGYRLILLLGYWNNSGVGWADDRKTIKTAFLFPIVQRVVEMMVQIKGMNMRKEVKLTSREIAYADNLRAIWHRKKES